MFDNKLACPLIEEIAKKHNAKLLQVFLYAADDVRRFRAQQRVKQGNRHAMHRDSGFGVRQAGLFCGKLLNRQTSDFKRNYRNFSEPIEFSYPSQIARIDTSYFKRLNLGRFYEQIDDMIHC